MTSEEEDFNISTDHNHLAWNFLMKIIKPAVKIIKPAVKALMILSTVVARVLIVF